MKKNLYLWIFIGVATLLCCALLIELSGILGVKSEDGFRSGNIEREDSVNKKEKSTEISAEPDLTLQDVDFEEDPADLADDFVGDDSFDLEPDLESLEKEVE
ncbi:MAG: hypothetical protein RBR98_02120 [Candidatus Moranbacteria bacterium]|jgi:hypothetical protein|nr:hypothetical protein [Candidatus Moranbacteria bacterium]NLC31368.1 hypothetical protein [Candidatus Moranbacteria bacterium]